MTGLLLALALGFAAGLRALTPPAAVALAYGGLGWKIVAALAALVELVFDALPIAPSRTGLRGLVARLASGAVCGGIVASEHAASAVAGAAIAAVAALAGTYGGHAARLRAIAAIGGIPAALAEDVVAIGLAAVAVTR